MILTRLQETAQYIGTQVQLMQIASLVIFIILMVQRTHLLQLERITHII